MRKAIVKLVANRIGLKHKYSLILDPLKYRVIGALKYQIKQSIRIVSFGMMDVIRVK